MKKNTNYRAVHFTAGRFTPEDVSAAEGDTQTFPGFTVTEVDPGEYQVDLVKDLSILHVEATTYPVSGVDAGHAVTLGDGAFFTLSLDDNGTPGDLGGSEVSFFCVQKDSDQ